MVYAYLAMRLRASAPEIAEYLGMPLSTVVGVLGKMVDRDLISRGPTAASRRGRPNVIYRLRLPGPIAACQFDGSQCAGAIFDASLGILGQDLRPLGKVEHAEQAAALVREFLGDLCRSAGLGLSHLPGVAISVNAVRIGGRFVTSSVLPWVDQSVEQRFSQALDLPVRVAFLPGLIAEYQKQGKPVPQSLIVFRVGDGVSAHACINGQPYLGSSSLEGELGHVIADPAGPLCGCGRRGCLEALCSGPAIHQRVLRELEAGVVSSVRSADLARGTPREAIGQLWAAWEAGDTYVRACLEQVFDQLAWGLGMVVNLLDPERIVLGGYVLCGHAAWQDEIIRRAQRWIFHAADRRLRFEPSRVTAEDELRVIGASFYYEPFLAGRPQRLGRVRRPVLAGEGSAHAD